MNTSFRLTPREQQVLEMLTLGWPNKQIADALFLSQDTVKFHLKGFYRKVGARSRLEAVAIASRLGLLQPPRIAGSRAA